MAGRMHLRSFVVGMCETNCYIAADSSSKDAIIIDPGDNADAIIETIRTDGLIVRAIVNTHGHADHIAANAALKKQFDCPIMIHELDAPYLADPEANLSALIGYIEPISPPADRLLKDGGEITIGQLVFRVIHTPGHTPGGISLLENEVLFSGDTLFADSVGRTDFPGGSHEQLINSIQEKLLVLPDSTLVYPGHGPLTTIGNERQNNPFLQ